MLIVEARHQFDRDAIEYLALYAGFPISDPRCVAPEFSVERNLEKVKAKDKAGVPFEYPILTGLIIRNENNEALKIAERD